MNDIVWTKFVALLVLPPGIIIIVGLLGLFMIIWRRSIGAVIFALSIVALFLLSVPLVGKRLLIQIEAPFHSQVVAHDKLPRDVQAIVILGGGRNSGALEYGGDTVNAETLERLRYGVRLASLTNLPILVSGGPVFGEEQSEASLMQQVLQYDFGTKAKWLESDSRNTVENARYTKKMLAEAGIRKVYLVTHAWHMQRAQWAFIDAGLDVVPAPMGFTAIGRGDLTALGYVPSAPGLRASTQALRERLGYYWYQRKRDAETASEVTKEVIKKEKEETPPERPKPTYIN